MAIDTNTLLVALVGAVLPSAFGWLLLRAVRGVDRTLEGLGAKVDQLGRQDTLIQVEIADLRARVTYLEYLAMGKIRTTGEQPAVKP